MRASTLLPMPSVARQSVGRPPAHSLAGKQPLRASWLRERQLPLQIFEPIVQQRRELAGWQRPPLTRRAGAMPARRSRRLAQSARKRKLAHLPKGWPVRPRRATATRRSPAYARCRGRDRSNWPTRHSQRHHQDDRWEVPIAPIAGGCRSCRPGPQACHRYLPQALPCARGPTAAMTPRPKTRSGRSARPWSLAWAAGSPDRAFPTIG